MTTVRGGAGARSALAVPGEIPGRPAGATRPGGRTRDPARKQRILDAAAELMAVQGFHAVSMEQIGEAVGITASAIYRHYDAKTAMLAAMFDRAIDGLLAESARLAADVHSDPAVGLGRLVDAQIGFVVGERDVAQVYFRELAHLPEVDRRTLRRKQRLHVEEWTHLLTEWRPELDDTTARTVVHCAIGAIQSTLNHGSGLADPHLRAVLRESALAVLLSAGTHTGTSPTR
ncbi:MAG: TetR/AcrR family transcriptional regulator [Propionibacteriales bacterium]|nr:TetR/AcrR family transcriptional regulator [Propionibacteriales bacterium]